MGLPTTYAEIDLSAIAHNVRQIKQKAAPAKVMAVVKANAYGHGVLPIVETALNSGADFIGVALAREGVDLRQAGVKAPILVFGGFFAEQIEAVIEHDLCITLYDLHRAEVLSKTAMQMDKKAKVHIKVDTGMGRVGIEWSDAADFVAKVNELPGLKIDGIYTHFATSDWKDKEFALLQLQRFKQVIEEVRKRQIEIPIIHAANSGAILDLPDSYFGLVRPGISMYGYYPSNETTQSIKLKPALSLKTKVLAIKAIKKGGFAGYNLTYQAKSDTHLAVIAIGYADGFNRLLSNQAEVLIRGKRYPVAGTVSMDQTSVEIGNDNAIAVGDEVVVIGRQQNDEISIYELCRKLNTIPYEITCWLSQRVLRVYREN